MLFDLHVHSKYSLDSRMEPGRIVETAKKRGLDGIAVVDHGSTEGGLEAAEYARGTFIVIPGMEIATPLGHIVGLFLSRPITSIDPEEAIARIHEQNGIAVLPHPLEILGDVPEKILQELDAIEVHNARSCTMRMLAARYGEEQLRRLTERYDLALLGVSDAHFHGEIGCGITEISASTAQEVRSAILEKKTRVEGRRTSWVYRFMSGMLRIVSPTSPPKGGRTSKGRPCKQFHGADQT